MTPEQAKNEIKELEKYIYKIENYNADTFEKEAVYLYVLLESVTKVAEELNIKKYRVGNRKVIGKDISDILRRNLVFDELHLMAKRMFSRNKKRASSKRWI